jgi:ribosomal protein L29
MKNLEIENLSVNDLMRSVSSLQKELFDLRLQRVSGQVKDVSQFRKLRVKIAQILTFIKQKEVS